MNLILPHSPSISVFRYLSPLFSARICNAICNAFLLALLLSSLTLAQEQPRIYRVPFHTVNDLILLDGQLHGKPATLLLDTGSNVSFLDVRSSPIRFKAEKVRRIGMSGCISVHARLVVGAFDLSEQRLCVADLSDVSKSVKAQVDGFIGSDVLSEFAAVRIDYKAGLVEFEQ